MIQSLYIRNYVLIDEMEMQFSEGFTTLTGETGAGKSILMGALSLVLGQRADTSVLKVKDSKCIVEGIFRVSEAYKEIFDANDVDFDPVSTIRREIAPGGKSRAFINDSPVNLPLLKEIGNRLVDIHSQHQNLRLNDHQYQLEVIDHLAGNSAQLSGYRDAYAAYRDACEQYDSLRDGIERLRDDLEFMQFQYNELHSAQLKAGELETLEEELQRAGHAEEIRNALFQSATLLSQESTGILDQIREALVHLRKVSTVYSPAGELSDRLESAYIELKDLSGEFLGQAERTYVEPGKLARLQERVDMLFSLMQKHRVKKLEEMIDIRDRLEEKIEEVTFSDEKLHLLENEKNILLDTIRRIAEGLSVKRKLAGKEIQEKVESQLKQLGIPNAKFRVVIEKGEDFDRNGIDDVRFLFSANKQTQLEEISRVASGGEVSRLMLCIKSLVSDRKGMPTLIFDEIDAGVSGEIADKVGVIMERLSSGRQVLAITHLPQVASRGQDHFVVYKEDTEEATFTRIRKLDREERITEIAKMLSGEEVTEAALSNARVLLRV